MDLKIDNQFSLKLKSLLGTEILDVNNKFQLISIINNLNKIIETGSSKYLQSIRNGF